MYYDINETEKIGEYRIIDGDIDIKVIEDFIADSKNRKANMFRVELESDPMHYGYSPAAIFTYLRAYRKKSKEEIKEEKRQMLQAELDKL